MYHDSVSVDLHLSGRDTKQGVHISGTSYNAHIHSTQFTTMLFLNKFTGDVELVGRGKIMAETPKGPTLHNGIVLNQEAVLSRKKTGFKLKITGEAKVFEADEGTKHNTVAKLAAFTGQIETNDYLLFDTMFVTALGPPPLNTPDAKQAAAPFSSIESATAIVMHHVKTEDETTKEDEDGDEVNKDGDEENKDGDEENKDSDKKDEDGDEKSEDGDEESEDVDEDDDKDSDYVASKASAESFVEEVYSQDYFAALEVSSDNKKAEALWRVQSPDKNNSLFGAVHESKFEDSYDSYNSDGSQ